VRNSESPRRKLQGLSKQSFTTLEAYINLFRGLVQRFQLLQNSKGHQVYFGWLLFNVTFIGNAECFKNTIQRYSKCSKFQKFPLKAVQPIHHSKPSKMNSLYAFKCKSFRSTCHTVTFEIPQ
jgi:hypothetical protein